VRQRVQPDAGDLKWDADCEKLLPLGWPVGERGKHLKCRFGLAQHDRRRAGRFEVARSEQLGRARTDHGDRGVSVAQVDSDDPFDRDQRFEALGGVCLLAADDRASGSQPWTTSCEPLRA
jgi:hypothetical protein